MDLYIGCVSEHPGGVSEHPDEETGRVGIGYVGVLNGVSVEGGVGYYSTTFIRGSLLSLIVPLQERQCATHIKVHCDMPLLMGLLQQDRVSQTVPSFSAERPRLSVKHHDLMSQYRQLSGFHDIRFDWLKPHTTHWGMVRAHQLALQAMDAPTEITDGV